MICEAHGYQHRDGRQCDPAELRRVHRDDERRRRAIDPEPYREAQRRWRASHPDYKHKSSAGRSAIWLREHPAEARAMRRRYYDKVSPGAAHRQQWTMRELDIIVAPGRSCDVEIARALGRTVKAIEMMRHTMKKTVAA